MVALAKVVEDIQLISVQFKDLDFLIDYSWQIYQNPLTKFYPIVDQKSDIESMYKHAFMNGNLWVAKSGQEYAILPLIIDEDKKFIQANGGIAAKTHFVEFSSFFLGNLRKSFPGYTFYCGYPGSHLEAMSFFPAHGFQMDDVLWRYESKLTDLVVQRDPVFEPLNEQNYKAFNSYHQAYFPDVYWTAPLIYEHQDRWSVVVVGEQTIKGIAGAIHYVKNDVRYAEIYFFHGSDVETIMSALIVELKKQEVQELLYLVDKSQIQHLAFVERIGFKQMDDYYGFIIEL